MSGVVVTQDFVDMLSSAGMWFCGQCESVIPAGYWHRCDEVSTNSGPHDDLPGT